MFHLIFSIQMISICQVMFMYYNVAKGSHRSSFPGHQSMQYVSLFANGIRLRIVYFASVLIIIILLSTLAFIIVTRDIQFLLWLGSNLEFYIRRGLERTWLKDFVKLSIACCAAALVIDTCPSLGSVLAWSYIRPLTPPEERYACSSMRCTAKDMMAES